MAASTLGGKEFVNKFKEEYAKVRQLLNDKNDTEEEPYHSRHKAKDILYTMCDSLKEKIDSETILENSRLTALLGSCLLNLGSIHLELKDSVSSEKVLNEAVELLSDDGCKPETIVTLINVYNNLGILWSNRGDFEQAQIFLVRGNKLYEDLKANLQAPHPNEEMQKFAEEFADNDILFLEKAHTLTLFSLAQVYDHIDETFKSSIYCHVALKRELIYNDYEPMDWALKAATLGQRFAERNGFYQSRHHLAAASIMFDQYVDGLIDEESKGHNHLGKLGAIKQRSAEIARCWVKYCVYLMTTSKSKIKNEDEHAADIVNDLSIMPFDDYINLCGGDIKSLKFPNIDVSKYESKVGDDFLLTLQDAKNAFVSGVTWMNVACQFYTIDTHPTDFIRLVQDCSQLYNHLAFFEEDLERKAKMHKRRVVMLEHILMEIKPEQYLHYCRQVWYELAFVYTEILDVKLEKPKLTNERTFPEMQVINALCDNACKYYELYLDSMKDANGVMPTTFDDDVVKFVIKAYALMGRTCMKRVVTDATMHRVNTLKCYNAFEAAVKIYNSHANTDVLNTEEYLVCQEVLKVLSMSVKLVQEESPSTEEP